VPRQKPPFPFYSGLLETVIINNVETLQTYGMSLHGQSV
jgi:NADH:ubiquinone oxidoreductase subunit F (NADH-binding)